jgi:hypothetical protein
MPVLGGYISTKHGWRSQFQIISAFLGPCVILIFLLVPESSYNRPAIFNTDYASADNLSELEEELEKVNKTSSPQDTGAKEAHVQSDAEGVSPNDPVGSGEKKKTFVQELKLFNGRFSDESFFKLLLAPFALFTYPATIWAFLFQGSFVTWVCGL